MVVGSSVLQIIYMFPCKHSQNKNESPFIELDIRRDIHMITCPDFRVILVSVVETKTRA